MTETKEITRLRAELATAHNVYNIQAKHISVLTQELATRQWQPIETAPDANRRKCFLGVDKHGNYFILHWRGNCFHDAESYGSSCTHWMPLPAPPTDEVTP